MRILLTGGSGLLGSQILKIDRTISAPTSKELDITNFQSVERAVNKYKPQAVLHLAAKTDPPKHEKNPELGLRVNILGTVNIASACLKKCIRLVYVSSDYLYIGQGPHKEDEPVIGLNNFYTSKLGGECAVKLCPGSLILRLSFGPLPFPWKKVYQGQKTNKLYVDEMAPLVLAAVKSKATGIMNLGGPATSLEKYAKRTVPNIATTSKPAWVQPDLTLNLTKMKKIMKISDLKKLIKHI